MQSGLSSVKTTTQLLLNYEEYVSKIESDRTYADQFDAVEEYDNNPDFTFSPADQKRISEDDIFLEKKRTLVFKLIKRFLCRGSSEYPTRSQSWDLSARATCQKIKRETIAKHNQQSVFI